MTTQNTAPTFTVGDGKVTTIFGTFRAYRDLKVQTDGKILVVGFIAGERYENGGIALARYNSDGSLDTTFDTDGKVTTQVGLYSSGNSVVVQLDGKILVAGTTSEKESTDYNFALIRYNSNGSLDTTFDTDGMITTLAGYNGNGSSVTVQADGKILVGGFSSDGFVLLRYDTNGSLDTTFDTDGKAILKIGNSYSPSFGESVALQPDGKILLAGGIYLNGDSVHSSALIRYNSDGSLDTTFDTDGMVITPNGFGNSVTVQADGKILLAAVYYPNGNTRSSSSALIRYNSDGSLDTTFDTDGVVITPNGSSDGVTIQADGKILVAGSALVRYNSNGSLDTTFDAPNSAGSNVAVQFDGKILAGAIARYNSNGGLDTTFGAVNTLTNAVVSTESNRAVVIAPAVNVIDAELFSQGNYNNARLTLQRHDIANTNDMFGANSPISFDNGVLSYSGTSIGTVTQSNGKLDLTFNSNAIQSAITTTLRSLTYTNVGNGGSEKIILDWTFSDGNTGSQGDGGVGTVTGTSVVNITDLTPPYVNNFIPTQGATNVALSSDIVLIFNESIQRGTGNIVLKNSLGTVIATYDAANSSNLNFTGNTLTINPSSDLVFSTRYNVELADGTVKDLSGNPYPYAGNYFKASYYEFTTAAPNSLPTGSVTITGKAEQNQTLSVNNSLADADGLGVISYQWLSNGNPISGANQSTYTLTGADVGKAISVKASYTDLQNHAESMTSTATALVTLPINYPPTGSVIISGTASQNQTLTVTNTLADANGLGVISYQWFRDGIAIDNTSTIPPKPFFGGFIAEESNKTYTLTNSDVGKTISVKASYTDLQGTSESVTSSTTALIAPPANYPPTGNVTISGTASQNQTLTVSNTLADANGLGTFSYQWLSDGNAISGKTQNSYDLTESDVDKNISVSVSYTDGLGKLENVTSNSVQIDNVNDEPTGSLSITGEAKVGATLSVQNTLVDADGINDLTFTWLGDGEIVGNGKSLLLTNAQKGVSINVVAGYVDNYGNTEEVSGEITENVIALNHAPTGKIAVKGLAKVGSELSLSNTLKDADGLGDFSYQWLSDGVEIDNATQKTYSLTKAEVGKKVSVAVSYTDGLDNFESIASVETTAVKAVAAISGLTKTGDAKNNKLSGLAGNDTITGGLGADKLTGGKGADIFKYTSVKDSGTTATTRDTITDFKRTEGDKIDLLAIDSNAKLASDQAFTFIGTKAFSTKDATGQLRFDATAHVLYGSTNADNKPEFSILLSGVKALVVDDFML